VLASIVKSLKGVGARQWLGYMSGGKCVCICVRRAWWGEACGDIGSGPRVVGRALGWVVGGQARCYPGRANNFGASDLVGKVQDV
jgi:hypothetical protein